MNRICMFVCVLGTVLVLNASGCDQKGKDSSSSASNTAGCPHGIKTDQCPFCTPTLIESHGFCSEHGTAEALCYQCRPYLKTAFRAKGDWCEKHKAPDSQCVACHPELAAKAKPGAGHGDRASTAAPSAAGACPHKIDQSKCPFCNPKLVDSEGFCKEHGVAEALCHRCRPYLKTAFQQKGDWCQEHDIPESQCTICNPDILKKTKQTS